MYVTKENNLVKAVREWNLEKVKRILAAGGYDPDFKDEDGKTVMDHAEEIGNRPRRRQIKDVLLNHLKTEEEK